VKTARKLGLLATLYLSQGLPFGFFTQSLPVLLRQEGVSLALVGSSSLLAAPWGLKFLWAPFVDRHGSARFGRRRSWILPLQALTVLLLVGLSRLEAQASLVWLFAGVFCANLLAATQDIATDALAVELLPESERGLGNGVQVAGFRVGMIVGGGLLLVVFGELGRSRAFLVMAGLIALCSLPIALHRESPQPIGLVDGAGKTLLSGLLAQLWRRLRRPRMGAWLLVLALYKAGDAFGSAMLRPMLVDRGQTLTDIGWLLGTVGALTGLLGALAGGALLRHLPRPAAVASFGASHGLSLLFYGFYAQHPGLPATTLYAGLGLEHFLGGMATVSLFTCMMDRSEAQTAGTDYTLQASLVAGATGLFGMLSGFSAQQFGYPLHFGLSTLLAWLGAALGLAVLLAQGSAGAASQVAVASDAN
jgi:PAT family beta-lactamase induction signal transducer AmpG